MVVLREEIQIVPTKEERMKTYAFKVVLEKDKWPDEPEEKAVWRAYIPALEHRGTAKGVTRFFAHPVRRTPAAS